LVALKDSVNIGFSVQNLSDEKRAEFLGKGKFMRHIKLHALKDIDEEKIISLLELIK